MPVFVPITVPVTRWRSLKGWQLGPAPGAFNLLQWRAAPSTPLPWVETGASEWKVRILSAALAPTGSRDQDLMDRIGASPLCDLGHRLVYRHLPRDCAYRNYFFVNTHNSEPALAPGFCFITFYWSRKKEHIITLLLHVFSWLKTATSTLCKQKSRLCCLRTGRWERQDEGLSQTIKETHHTKQAWGEWAGGLGNGGKKSFAHIHRLVQVLQVSVGKVIWAGMCQISLAEPFLLRGPFSDDFMQWWCFYKTKGVNQVVEGIWCLRNHGTNIWQWVVGLSMCHLLLPVTWGGCCHHQLQRRNWGPETEFLSLHSRAKLNS